MAALPIVCQQRGYTVEKPAIVDLPAANKTYGVAPIAYTLIYGKQTVLICNCLTTVLHDFSKACQDADFIGTLAALPISSAVFWHIEVFKALF